MYHTPDQNKVICNNRFEMCFFVFAHAKIWLYQNENEFCVWNNMSKMIMSYTLYWLLLINWPYHMTKLFESRHNFIYNKSTYFCFPCHKIALHTMICIYTHIHVQFDSMCGFSVCVCFENTVESGKKQLKCPRENGCIFWKIALFRSCVLQDSTVLGFGQ